MRAKIFLAGAIAACGGWGSADATPACETPVSIVYFDSGSTALSDHALTTMSQAVEQAMSDGSCPIRSVSVDSHADRTGPVAYNFHLSERRALMVRDELVRLGIDERVIITRAFGEDRNMVATPDGMNEARNRRVEILLSPN